MSKIELMNASCADQTVDAAGNSMNGNCYTRYTLDFRVFPSKCGAGGIRRVISGERESMDYAHRFYF